MIKLNNRGVTLIELLVSLTILAVFMTSVTYFISTMSRDTTKAKRQVQVQQDAQKVYDEISQMIMQSKCVILKTDGIASKTSNPYVSSNASGNAFTYNNGHNVEAGSLETDAGEFKKGYLVSKSAAEYLMVACKKYSDVAAYEAKANTDYVVASRGKVKLDYTSGALEPTLKSKTISVAQDEAAKLALSGAFASTDVFSTFQENEYNVEGLYLGPVTIDEDGTKYTTYNTLVYDGNKVYLNRSETGSDFSPHKENVIAENCYAFTVIPSTGDKNSLYVKMILVAGGAEGTVDATYSADANTVTNKTANKDGDFFISKSGYTYTVGGTVNIRNARVME